MAVSYMRAVAGVYHGQCEGVFGFGVAILEAGAEFSPRRRIFGCRVVVERVVAANLCLGYNLVVVVVVVLCLFWLAMVCGDYLQFCHRDDILE